MLGPKGPFLECGNTAKGQVLQSLLHPDTLVQAPGPPVRSRATVLEGRVFMSRWLVCGCCLLCDCSALEPHDSKGGDF